MAQQKMHCALRRTNRNTQKVSNGGMGSLSRKSLEQSNMGSSLEDYEVSSLVWRNTDHRCAILTFLTLEPDGHWRIVALPLHRSNPSNHLGSRVQVKMDGLHLVSQPSISSFKVDRQKVHRGIPDGTYSVKPFAAGSCYGSNVQLHSQNKALANKATKFNEFSSNSSCQNLLTSTDVSVLVPSGSNAISSSDMFTDTSSKVVKAVKRNSRRKARKKGKQNKKLSYDSGSTELEVFSEEGANGSSTPEACANIDKDQAGGPISYATVPVISFPGCRINRNDFEGHSNGTVNSSAMLKVCTSYIDEVDVSEAVLTSVDQKFVSEHPVVNSENGFQTNDPGFAISNRGIEDTHRKQISCFDNMSSKPFSNMQDSLVLNSASVARNGNDSTGAYDARKESNGIELSETPGYNVRKGFFSHRSSLNGFVDSHSDAEGTKCGSQGCSSSDMQLVESGKRGKQVKTLPRNSNVHRLGGKENNHSVWQKVQRSDADNCNCGSKKVNPVRSQFDTTLKEAPLLKRNCIVVEPDTLSKAEDKNHLKVKVSRKLKRKTGPGSKQEYKCYSRKGSHAIKARSNAYTKINMQQNGRLDISAQVNDKKGSGSVSRSHSHIGCQRVGFCTNRVECITSEPLHGSQVHADELGPIESVCNTASSMNDQTTENRNSSFSKPSDSLDQSNLLEPQSPPVYLIPIGKEVAEAEKEISVAEHSEQDHSSGSTLTVKEVAEVEREISVAEHSKHDHSSGSILQKWIPVGIKYPGLTSSRRSCSSLAHSDEPAAEDWISKRMVKEELASSSHNLIPSTSVGVACVGQSSGNVNCSFKDESKIQKLRDQNTCTLTEKNATANCLTHELKDKNISAFATDSNKLSLAVSDACRVQLASVAVQVATGSPIAEFESLLHSASPIICQSYNVISCQACSRDNIIGASLCRHEMPNISLGSLWQWYEKHGSYGLEVRAKDYENSKSISVDRFAFRAYFVPFLSAVQLFRSRKCSRMDNSSRVPSPEVSEAFKTGETSKNSSNVGRLPIFSILVPQPRPGNASLLPLVSQVCSSELSSVSAKDVISVQSVDATGSDDLELLFEYFEYEQPQQRRPLFEKIKELVRGGPSQCNAYGDPTTLASMDLHDLHPRSWYSVAWYPIYRIPEGNFRAAFLTYHSLGHLLRRSASFDSPSVDSCIVSPVVGLQSYNAQGECWFQPRHTALNQTAENLSLNPSEILKERMRTLEQTASLMARAAVTKGSLTSVNKHPDFEFFLSRRR